MQRTKKEYMADLIERQELIISNLKRDIIGMRRELEAQMGEYTKLEQLNAVYISKLERIQQAQSDD